MSGSPSHRWWLPSLAALCVGFAVTLPASALDPPLPRKKFDEGSHVFRRILFDMGVTALDNADQLDDSPEKTILIVLGDPKDTLPARPGWVAGFVRKGGAVLYASDQRVSSDSLRHGLAKLAGVSIDGRLLYSNAPIEQNGEPSYRMSMYCPFLNAPPPPADFLLRDPHAVPGLDAAHLLVATNLPSFLNIVPSDLPQPIEKLAYLPANCTTQVGRQGDVRGKSQLFAVGGELGTGHPMGRLLVLADHSIFINKMMKQPDNGNVEFAFNCLRYLRGPEKQRDRVLFVEEGTIIADFNIPLKEIPELPEKALRVLLATFEERVAHLEDTNFFNNLIDSVLDHHTFSNDRLLRWALVALTLAVMIYVIFRLTRSRGLRPEPGLPLLNDALPKQSAPTLHAQRQAGMLQSGSLWECARGLARQVFTAAGVEPATDGKVPRFAVPGGWWQRRQAQRRLARLWRLAWGASPQRVSLARWPHLLAELRDLRAGLADGSVRLL
jgi:hypothetical protein